MDRPVLDVIQENYDKIFPAERKVADYVLKSPQATVNQTVSELARLNGVSEATVVRMCHHLGYKGYYQFRLMLARDVGRSAGEEKEEPQQPDNPAVRISQQYAKEIIEMGENVDLETLQACVTLIKTCHQAHILAVGNTSPMALYMGFRLGRLGIKCTYGAASEYFMNHVNLAEKEDIIIAISLSGGSKQVIQGMELGKEKGLKMIAITGYRQSMVAQLADYTLISNGENEIFGFYKSYDHLKEMAMIDILLELVMSWKKIEEMDADKPEFLLMEYKL